MGHHPRLMESSVGPRLTLVLRDNTAIILFGDQGYCLGERDSHFGKGTLWERSYHVPIVLAMPCFSAS